MPKILASWRTSLAGLLAAIAASIPEIQKAIDGNEATVPQWGLVISAIGLAAVAFFARDNKVTSEQAGAKPVI